MNDSKYANDDNYITKLLTSNNVHSYIIDQVICLIGNVRKSSKYKYLNLEYLTMASYALVMCNMQIDHDYILRLDTEVIKSQDHETSYKTLVRYCSFVIKIQDIL